MESQKITVKPKILRKVRIKNRAMQRPLFNHYGDPVFSFHKDVSILELGVVRIGNMYMNLPSSLGSAQDASRIVVEALLEFRHLFSSQGNTRPLTFEIFSVKSCTVSFRPTREDRVIHAKYSSSSDSMELLLPHPTISGKCGLSWLTSYEPCCDRNRLHPTPWMGRVCSCVVEYY